jgi:F-type H+-transporting ATPase subunit b
LSKATAKALAGIEAVAADAAADIVAKVSGAKVTPAQAATAVKAVMSHG